MAGNDASLLVIAGRVASKLKDFRSEILEDSSEVDGGTGTDALRVVALAEKTVNTTDRECQASLGGSTIGSQVRDEHIYERGGQARKVDSRLRVLGTTGLAAGLATSSHCD